MEKLKVLITRVKNSFYNHMEEFFLQSAHVESLLSTTNILDLQRLLQVKLL